MRIQPEPLAGIEFPKLDPFKADIDAWLTEDKKAKRKQRHTAKRVYQRLMEKHPEVLAALTGRWPGMSPGGKRRFSAREPAICPWSIFREKRRGISETLNIMNTASFIAANT